MRKTILTCAVTGAGAIRSPHIPITPAQIAVSAIEAAEAGAAIVHLHARDPDTGEASMEFRHYAEIVERIRASRTDVVINLTGGPGARFSPSKDNPLVGTPASTLCLPPRRVEHVVALKPELSSLDVATLCMGEHALINTPADLREMAAAMREAGIKPELEIFDSGGIALAKQLIADGLIDGQPLFQLVLGVAWGATASPDTLSYLARQLPADCQWAAFGISRMQYPMLAQSLVLGGHVRVGLEDNIYSAPGVLAKTNAELVARGVQIVRLLGHDVATPAEAREMLGLHGNPERSRAA
jgi:uncharacterized protein (DUF849 family)